MRKRERESRAIYIIISQHAKILSKRCHYEIRLKYILLIELVRVDCIDLDVYREDKNEG